MIILSGSNGVVGQPLSQRLDELGHAYIKLSRQPAQDASAIRLDLESDLPEQTQRQLKGCKTLIHCAPIWLLPAHLSVFKQAGLQRLIVFSSTSVISKRHSKDAGEQQLVENLMAAEQMIGDFCQQNRINHTILRPSLIYGYGLDNNITHIAQRIKRFRTMFVVGDASGLRQPVHADDLVEVVLNIIDNEKTYGRSYNLAGCETLTYRNMVERIFIGLKIRPRIFSLNLTIARLGLRILKYLTGFSYSPEMADRMNQDLNYDISSAVEDFEYQPQPFLSRPDRDLVNYR